MSPSGRFITAAALGMLMLLEGLELMPYKDIAGVWTDGYGNTENVVPGRPITQAKANRDLQHNTLKAVQSVERVLGPDVPQGMLDAFTLLTVNIGAQAFADSTAAKAYKAGDYSGACLYATRYNKATVKGHKRVVRGLAKRRLQEYELCVVGVPSEHWNYSRYPASAPPIVEQSTPWWKFW